MASPKRWLRLLWPELVFGASWVAILLLIHTLFTDDDAWQHRVLDGLQWLTFAGYVVAAAAAHRGMGMSPDTAD